MADLRIPNFEQSRHVLQQTPVLLRNLLAAAPREALNWRPSSERWSIAMVLAHLADVEIRGFRDRFEPMLRSKHPALAPYEPWDLFRDKTEFDAAAELARFAERRTATLALLGGMPDGAGDRTGQHEELGLITIAQLVNEFAFHDLGHIRQIMELYRSRVFFPEMGVYQGFYKINP